MMVHQTSTTIETNQSFFIPYTSFGKEVSLFCLSFPKIFPEKLWEMEWIETHMALMNYMCVCLLFFALFRKLKKKIFGLTHFMSHIDIVITISSKSLMAWSVCYFILLIIFCCCYLIQKWMFAYWILIRCGTGSDYDVILTNIY